MAEDILKKYKEEQTNSLKEYLKSQINLIKSLGKTELADKNIPKEDKAIFKDVISQITSTMNVGSKPKREAYITAGKELTEIQKSLTSLAEDPDLKFNKGFMAALNAPTKNSATGIALNFIKEKQPSLPGAAASGAVNKMKEVSGGFLKTMAMDIVGGLPFGGAIVDWASTKVEGAVEGIGKGKKLTETELGVGRAFSPGGTGGDDEEEENGAEGNGGTSSPVEKAKEELLGGEVAGGGEGLGKTNEILSEIEEHLQYMADNMEDAESRRERLRDKGAKKAGGAVVGKGMEGMDDDDSDWSFLEMIGLSKMLGLTKLLGGKGGIISNIFRNVKAILLKSARKFGGGGGAKLMQGILKGIGLVAKIGAIAGVLIAPIIDGIMGYFNAEEWGVSKLSGIIGGILGGGEGGGINAIFNSMKWAAAGAAAGTLIMPGVGTIIGGIAGAILGAILGFFGGDKIAKLMDSIGEWIGEKWAKLKVFLGFEKETEGAATKRIAEERKTLETQLETAKKKKINAKTGFASQDIKDENIARMEAELGQLDEQSVNLSAGLGGITEEEKASKIKRTQSKLDMMKSHLPNATAHQKEMWVTGVGGELGEIEKLENELKLLQEAEIPHSQTGMGISETTDEKGGLLVAHRGEEVVEKEEISALKEMIRVAKETLTGNLKGVYGKGAKYDVLKGDAQEGAERYFAGLAEGGKDLAGIMRIGMGGKERVGVKGAENLIDVLTSPEFGDTMGISAVQRKGEKKKGYLGASGRGAKIPAWGWSSGGGLKSKEDWEGEGERGLDTGLLTSIRDWQKDIAEIVSQERFKMEFGMTRPEAYEKAHAEGVSIEDAEEKYGYGPKFMEAFGDLVRGRREKPEKPLGQSLLAQEMQREFDANIGQIQYEKAAGIGEFETSRPQTGTQLNAAAMDRVGFGREKSSIAPTIIDASTVQNVSNNTLIRPPSPSGQFLPGERRDFG